MSARRSPLEPCSSMALEAAAINCSRRRVCSLGRAIPPMVAYRMGPFDIAPDSLYKLRLINLHGPNQDPDGTRLTMTRPLSLALVQAPTAPTDDIGAFASHLEQLTRLHTDTHLFVHPELHLTGLGEATPDETQERIEVLAQPLDGPRDRALAELAGDLGRWLGPRSFYERGADGSIYNTTAAYSPEGRRVASYRKVFPWRPYETVAAGSEFVVFDMAGFGRVGLSICYDAWFPESSRHLAWMGAELILNLVQTPTSDRAQEITIAKANAIVNQVFVASLNAA